MITQGRIKEVLSYEAATGVFKYKVTYGSKKKGGMAGWVNDLGYRWIELDGSMYRAARLAWVYVYGTEPTDLEHIDGDRDSNRISNLRESNPRDIRINNSKRKGGKLLGASFYKRSGTWISYIRFKGIKYHIGYYRTEIAAHKAYLRAAEYIKIHGCYPSTQTLNGL
jgi:hypothetical protein